MSSSFRKDCCSATPVKMESDGAVIAERDKEMLDQYFSMLYDWLDSYEKELDVSIDALKKWRDSLVYKAKS